MGCTSRPHCEQFLPKQNNLCYKLELGRGHAGRQSKIEIYRPACGFGNISSHAEAKKLARIQRDRLVGVIENPKFISVRGHKADLVVANNGALANDPVSLQHYSFQEN